MFKRTFLSPFFMPIFYVILWAVLIGSVYAFYPNNVIAVTKEGAFLEVITHAGYVLLIAVLLWVCDDFKDRVRTWGIFLFLAIVAFLREMGIQHHLSATDTTPFKSRFFLNPNNLLSEKIVYGALLLIILGAVLYLAFKYSKHLIHSFFEFNPITWSIAVLCTVGVMAKIIDRFPSKWRKIHNGVSLPDDIYQVFQLLEESSEMFLPYIAALILVQYHLLKKK